MEVGHGGIGRRGGFRSHSVFPVRVRVLLPRVRFRLGALFDDYENNKWIDTCMKLWVIGIGIIVEIEVRM